MRGDRQGQVDRQEGRQVSRHIYKQQNTFMQGYPTHVWCTMLVYRLTYNITLAIYRNGVRTFFKRDHVDNYYAFDSERSIVGNIDLAEIYRLAGFSDCVRSLFSVLKIFMYMHIRWWRTTKHTYIFSVDSLDTS